MHLDFTNIDLEQPKEIQRIITEALVSYDDDDEEDLTDADYTAIRQLMRFIRTQIPEYKSEGSISSEEKIRLAAPNKYPKVVQVKRCNTLKTNIDDITEYVARKPTRPQPFHRPRQKTILVQGPSLVQKEEELTYEELMKDFF